jgi:hypothetical protein
LALLNFFVQNFEVATGQNRVDHARRRVLALRSVGRVSTGARASRGIVAGVRTPRLPGPPRGRRASGRFPWSPIPPFNRCPLEPRGAVPRRFPPRDCRRRALSCRPSWLSVLAAQACVMVRETLAPSIPIKQSHFSPRARTVAPPRSSHARLLSQPPNHPSLFPRLYRSFRCRLSPGCAAPSLERPLLRPPLLDAISAPSPATNQS